MVGKVILDIIFRDCFVNVMDNFLLFIGWLMIDLILLVCFMEDNSDIGFGGDNIININILIFIGFLEVYVIIKLIIDI